MWRKKLTLLHLLDNDFWIGGKAYWNDNTGLQWKWSNEKSSIIKSFFWEQNKEEPQDSYENVCIKLTKNSWFKDWKPGSCSDTNRVLCQKDISKELQRTDSQLQCDCLHQFSGTFCEINKADTHFACSNNNLLITCPVNTFIHIQFAQFGVFPFNIIGTICPVTESPNTSNTTLSTCTDTFTLITIKNLCQAKNECSAAKISSLFDYSICSQQSGTALKYRYSCEAKETFEHCPDQMNLVDGRCFKVVSNLASNWYNARQDCGKSGGDLIDPKSSPQLHSFIVSTFDKAIIPPKSEYQYWEMGFMNDQEGNCTSKQCPCFQVTSSIAASFTSSLVNCQQNLNWICEGSSLTEADRSLSSSRLEDTDDSFANINTLEEDEILTVDKSCGSVTWFSLTFERTEACKNASTSCGKGQVAVLECDCLSGEWNGLPDTRKCKHDFFRDIYRRLEDAGEDILNITSFFEENLKKQVEAGSLYAGDLTESVNVITKLLDFYSKTHDHSYDQKFVHSLAQSGDWMFSENNREVWSTLKSDGLVQNVSSLITLLERAVYAPQELQQLETQLTNWEFIVIPDYKPPPKNPPRLLGVLAAPAVPTQPIFPFIELPALDSISGVSRRKRQIGNDSIVDNSVNVAYFVYKNLPWLLPPGEGKIINSLVIGTTLNDPQNKVQFTNNQTVKVTLHHLRRNNVENVSCVFWDTKTLSWKGDGCYVLTTQYQSTTCACNHLTNFAILVDIRGGSLDSLSEGAADALELISIFGCALSILFLTVSVILFQCLQAVHSERILIHRNLCITLLFAELVYIIGIHRTSNVGGCRAVAILLHFLFLSTFCWMLVEGLELYRLLIKVFEPDQTHMHYYYAFSVFVPVVVVAFSAGFGWRSYGTENYCWIDSGSGVLWTFVGPVIGVIAVNVVILLVALKVVLSVRSRDRSTGNRIMGWLKGSTTLLCLLGITWVFGFMSAIRKVEPVFTFVFTILNSMQGIFIFTLHILLNQKIQKALIKSVRKKLAIFSKERDHDAIAQNKITKQENVGLWEVISRLRTRQTGSLTIMTEQDNTRSDSSALEVTNIITTYPDNGNPLIENESNKSSRTT
uniref:Adhesion G protein-coupled receptor E1 n=1 Tax=Rhabditophanes sp. KR3021 TaxID=114890 RepID=A0AC35THK6_9BILA